jgi:hypothetical protein
MRDLGVGEAWGVNASGEVVGYLGERTTVGESPWERVTIGANPFSPGTRAFLYSGGRMKLLPLEASVADSINVRGEIVGSYYVGNSEIPFFVP